MNTKIFSHRNLQLVLILVELLTCLEPARANVPPDDQADLQGTWQATAAVDGGTPEYESRVSLLKLKIKGDHYTYDFGDHSFSADFNVDPTKTPKEMNVTFLEGPQTGKTMRAIYSLDGDTLKICTGLYARPKDFVSTLEAQSILFTFQRDLPSKDITASEIVSYGIYKSEPVTKERSETKAGAPVVYVTPQLIEQTLMIPATLDTQFGFQFVVHGAPKGKQVKLREVFLYPPTTDEITGKTTTQDEIPIQVGIEDGEAVGVLCKLNKRSDLVPGTWTIQVYDHDKKLLEKVFTMVKP